MQRKLILVGPFIILFVWSIVSIFKLTNPLFIPPIYDTASKFFLIITSSKYNIHIIKSLNRLLWGYLMGLSIGIPIGLLMGASRKINESLELVVDFCRSIPVASLFPLFLLFFGIGDFGKFCIVAWSSSLIMLINTMYGVMHIKETRLLVAKSFGTSKIQMFTKIIIPESLPEMFVGFRQSISVALIVVLVAEMFMGTEKGLGVLIQDSALTYDVDIMYAAIIITGILGYLCNMGIVLIEKKIVHWSGK